MRDQDKILGVRLDSIMTLDVLIASIRAAYQIIMHTRRINSNSIRQYITDGAVQTLTQSLVTLCLDYCNIIYNGLPVKAIRKMQLAQNSAARLIKRTPNRDHITAILQELHWLPVVKHSQCKILVFTFKSFNNVAGAWCMVHGASFLRYKIIFPQHLTRGYSTHTFCSRMSYSERNSIWCTPLSIIDIEDMQSIKMISTLLIRFV